MAWHAGQIQAVRMVAWAGCAATASLCIPRGTSTRNRSMDPKTADEILVAYFSRIDDSDP